MHITRRGFTAGAVAALGVGVTGCSANNDDGTAGPGDSFTFWSSWQQGEDQQKILADEIQKFTEATGITVDVQWAGREVLSQVVPRMTAGNPPDLVDASPSDIYSTLGLDNVMSLADVWDMEITGEEPTTIGEVIPEAAMATITNDDGDPYLVPYTTIGNTVWFNALITPDLTDSPPTTWQEFIGYLDERKAQGRAPIALDGDIADYCAYWLGFALLRAGGSGVLADAVQDPSGAAFEKQAWVDATEAVHQLIDGAFFPEGFRGTQFPTQQAAWADQTSKTDLILMGTWLPSETTASLEKSGRDPGSMEFGSFQFPAVGENVGEGIVVADSTGFAIPAKARSAEAAKQFIAWFLNKDRIVRIATEAKNLTSRADVEAPPELARFSEEYAEASEIVPFADGISQIEPQWVTDIWQPAVTSFFSGDLDAAQLRSHLAEKTVQFHENAG